MTEQPMGEYNLAWRRIGDRCEARRSGCEKQGEGWVLTTDRPMVVGFYCAEHAKMAEQNYGRLSTQTVFAKGAVTDDGFISLNVQWQVSE